MSEQANVRTAARRLAEQGYDIIEMVRRALISPAQEPKGRR